VAVKVLVEFEDEVLVAAVAWIFDCENCLRAIGEASGVGPVRGRDKDHLGGRAGLADCVDDSLQSGGPDIHIEVNEEVTVGVFLAAVVRLVHDAKHYARLRLPVSGDLGPRFGKVASIGSVLTDDAAPPATVVVDVDAISEVRRLPLLRDL
jgi:hypothetical protein